MRSNRPRTKKDHAIQVSSHLPAVRFHRVGRHRLAYIAHNEDGRGVPMIWIHGATASVRFWEAAQFERIREHHPWYAVSLPFHHPSSFEGEVDPDDLTEQKLFILTRDLIRHLVGDRPVILVGYSVGGFAALNFAAKQPEQTLAIVNIGGFARGRAKGLEGVLEFLATGGPLGRLVFHCSWWWMQQHIGLLRLAVRAYAYDNRALRRYAYLEPTLRNIWPDVKRHNRTAMRQLFAWLLKLDVTDEMANLKMPILSFAGECDPVIPYEHQRKFAERLENCRFISLPETGHVVFAERPEIFEREFLKFVAEIDRAYRRIAG